MKLFFSAVTGLFLSFITQNACINRSEAFDQFSILDTENDVRTIIAKPLPVYLKCYRNKVVDKDIYELVQKYLATKKMKTISIHELSSMMSQVPFVFNYRKYTPQEAYEKRQADMPTLARDITLNLFSTNGVADSIHVSISDAPQKKGTKYSILGMSNSTNISQENFIFSAIDSCISLKYLK
jgi:hypothetical protein